MTKTANVKSKDRMKEFLKLSTKNELVFATESGRFVQLTQLDIVDGVEWVLDNLPPSA